MTHVSVIFRGRVQGVGFRATVRECVAGSAVTGFVRNLDDGTVEAVFEGERAAIDAVLDRVRAAMAGGIEGEAVRVGDATGEFANFTIRR